MSYRIATAGSNGWVTGKRYETSSVKGFRKNHPEVIFALVWGDIDCFDNSIISPHAGWTIKRSGPGLDATFDLIDKNGEVRSLSKYPSNYSGWGDYHPAIEYESWAAFDFNTGRQNQKLKRKVRDALNKESDPKKIEACASILGVSL